MPPTMLKGLGGGNGPSMERNIDEKNAQLFGNPKGPKFDGNMGKHLNSTTTLNKGMPYNNQEVSDINLMKPNQTPPLNFSQILRHSTANNCDVSQKINTAGVKAAEESLKARGSSGQLTRVPSGDGINETAEVCRVVDADNDTSEIQIDDLSALQAKAQNQPLSYRPVSRPQIENIYEGTKAATTRYVILPGGMYAKPTDVYVESLPGGEGRSDAGCIAMSLQNLLERYDLLDKHYYRLKQENSRLRTLLFELYQTLPQVHPDTSPQARNLREALGLGKIDEPDEKVLHE